MLEVDEDSRLGNEFLAGGSRYHAHHVPDDDLTADLYLAACERLEKGGVRQYEISNFAREVTHGIGLRDSRHNLKYWTRQPYLGFGVDAHSMLPANDELKMDVEPNPGAPLRRLLAEGGRARDVEPNPGAPSSRPFWRRVGEYVTLRQCASPRLIRWRFTHSRERMSEFAFSS